MSKVLEKSGLVGKMTFLLYIVLFFILYGIYIYINTPVEKYTYTIKELEENSAVKHHNPGKSFTEYVHSQLYDENGKKTNGFITAEKNFIVFNNKHHVTGTMTIKTDKGSLSCIIYYETNMDTLYLYGKIQNVIVENETGEYAGRINTIHLYGKDDGSRELTIVSRPKIFWFI